MTDMRDDSRRSQRLSGDDGAAIVEFSIVMIVLFMLLYGIISFGLLLSFRQNLVQSAAEGARAGAVAPTALAAPGNALTAVTKSVAAYNRTCSGNPLACNTAAVGDCDAVNDPGGDQCITVTLTYDYDADPLLPHIPLMDQFLPSTIEVHSTAQLNP